MNETWLVNMLKSLVICVFLSLLPHQTVQDVDPKDIKTVHLIFMNHLDVGFNGIKPEVGFVNNIINKYFHEYFPRAIQRANELRGLGYNERMIYTTHAWLVSLFIDCPPNMILSGIILKCPNETELKDFNKAVLLGDITWHSGPMNMQNEMFDVSMTDFSLQMAADLDRFYNITKKAKTLSQRDVPGMSQALLPILAKHGIKGITVGVNGATVPPAVPKIFNWKFQDTSLIAMWHPGGYPNKPGVFPLMPGGLSAKDCVTFEGFHEAMCFAFRSDNAGPPESMKEVLLYYEITRSQFTNAFVQGSSFDKFVAEVESVKDQLPVINQEMGDVWIQGVSSDPLKVAKMRAFYRARTECFDKGLCYDKRVYNSSRFLVKLAEHTWGIDGCYDQTNWTNSRFYNVLKKNVSSFQNAISSWHGQRAFLDMALTALGDHPLADMVNNEWAQIKSTPPDLKDFEEVPVNVNLLQCDGGFKFEFSKAGYLITLVDPTTGINWASEANPIGQFIYQTYNQSDFDQLDAASLPYSKHFFLGIGKPNLTKNANAESKFWPTRLIQRYRNKNNYRCDYLIHLQFIDRKPSNYYGAPSDVWIRYTQPLGELGLNIELQWYNKPPTRLPEAIFFSFQPTVQSGYKWQLHKLGQLIDPLDVMTNGSQRLHGIDQGVMYSKFSSGLQIKSLDAALVTVLTSQNGASGLPLPLTPIKDVNGMAFNLFNNLWNVNYIFWYPFTEQDKNQKFRFRMNFCSSVDSCSL